MSEKFEQEVNEVMTEEQDWMEAKGDFEGEVWLSTDGKNTVRIQANTADGRRQGLQWAKLVYERLLKVYGTKQKLNSETYNKPEVTKDDCPHTNKEVKVSSGQKKPENKGRAYRTCKDCKSFLGWVE